MNGQMTLDEIERAIADQTVENRQVGTILAASVRAFMEDPDAKILTIAKLDHDGENHYLIDLS